MISKSTALTSCGRHRWCKTVEQKLWNNTKWHFESPYDCESLCYAICVFYTKEGPNEPIHMPSVFEQLILNPEIIWNEFKYFTGSFTAESVSGRTSLRSWWYFGRLARIAVVLSANCRSCFLVFIFNSFDRFVLSNGDWKKFHHNCEKKRRERVSLSYTTFQMQLFVTQLLILFSKTH